MHYQQYYEKYIDDGCIKIENFLSPEEVELLKQGLADIVENAPEDTYLSPNGDFKKQEGFIGQEDKIAYLFETDSADLDGNFIDGKKKALKYIGFGIHWWNSQCKQISFGKKIKDLLRAFGYKDPVICQSMFVFKNPKVEGVVPHQDSSFLYTESPSCVCLWMPLEDTSVENGCMWFLPGSHKSGKIYQLYQKNTEEDPFMVTRGDFPDVDQNKYVPIPTKKGDLGILHGSTLHKGSRNNTDKARAVYTLFIIEKGEKWSKLNEGQANENRTFSSLFEN